MSAAVGGLAAVERPVVAEAFGPAAAEPAAADMGSLLEVVVAAVLLAVAVAMDQHTAVHSHQCNTQRLCSGRRTGIFGSLLPLHQWRSSSRLLHQLQMRKRVASHHRAS